MAVRVDVNVFDGNEGNANKTHYVTRYNNMKSRQASNAYKTVN